MMKSVEQLTRDNNVKSLRLNNTDRQIFESYMTYVRADMRVNAYESEKMLQHILDHLLKAEDKGTHAMDFFNHDPKSHAIHTIKTLPNHTIINIFKTILRHLILLLGVFCFLKGYLGFFINDTRLYLYTFPITFIIGLFVLFLFIWACYKMVQLQAFSYSRFSWFFGYIVIIALFITLFLLFFFPQNFLQWGPYINIGNWTFILISFVVIPIGLFINDRQGKKKKTQTASWRYKKT